jgi:hypothetical protein
MSNGDQMRECPAHCAVSLHAYELWLRRGAPLWDDQEDWFAAERDSESQRNSSENRRELFVRWRAEELWMLSGRPFGRDLEFWHRAERHVDDWHAFIARVAFRKWEEEGRPEGAAVRHWIEAQREVGCGVRW